MKKLIKYFIERSLVVNIFSLMLIILGSMALIGLQKETFPQVDFDVIIITTPYPSSTPEEVEKSVTIPIERELKGVNGIKKMNALSSEGVSIITLEVEPDEELSEVVEDVKNAVDSANRLPEEVESSKVISLNNKQRALIKIPLTGGTYDELRRASKKLRDRLERLPEIVQVGLDGYRVDEIRVEIDPLKLNQGEVSIEDVHKALVERNLNLSSGIIKASGGDLFVRTLAEFESIEDIKNVVIRSNPSGQRILIQDIAQVKRLPTENSLLLRSNGKRSIFLDVKARSQADILKTTKKIKKEVEHFFQSDPSAQKIEHSFTDDLSYYVKRRLGVLKDNSLVGMGLVFLCLMAFLNFRISVVTSLGAPLAFMFSFLMMDSMGLSINLISMFALILVLGMLVDDAIIVSEHFYQKIEKGMAPKQAALEAAFETIRPVTATIITTMIAFGSLFFMGGIMGKFLWSVPAVVILCLAASWLECFFILPSHLADFVKISRHKGKRWYEHLTSLYGRLLERVLKHPWIVQNSFLFLLIGSAIFATKMNFELFPGDDVRIVFVQIKGKVGAPLKLTDQAVQKLEQLSLKELRKEEYEHIKAMTGVLFEENRKKTGSHYGSLTLYLTSPGERERSTDEIIKAILPKAKSLTPHYVVSVRKMQGGPPKGKAVDIQLSGDSLKNLKKASGEARALLQKLPGITTTEIDFEDGKEQVVISVNDGEARRLGLSTSKIARELRNILSGQEVTKIQESDEDIKIRLFLEEQARSDLNSLKLLHINNKQGNRVPLHRIVTLSRQPGAFVIRRLNGKRVISVQASIDKSKTNPIKITRQFRPQLEKVLQKYPELSYTFGGENENTKESMNRLAKSGIMAMFCIFLVLVIMFNSLIHPVVVMMAIPLGLIGVVWTFFFFNQSLGFMALMGIVALMGVVVNDSIVLVAFINKKRKEGKENLLEAVKEAACSRFRPVILTTFTTVAGLMPIAHPSISKILTFGRATDSDPFIQPMALSFAWGLLFASMVTLIFIPCNYLAFEKSRTWIKHIFFRLKNTLARRLS